MDRNQSIKFGYFEAMVVLAGLICLRQRLEARGSSDKLFWRVEHLRQIFSSYEYAPENPQLQDFHLRFGDAQIFNVARRIVYREDTPEDYKELAALEPKLRMSDDA